MADKHEVVQLICVAEDASLPDPAGECQTDISQTWCFNCCDIKQHTLELPRRTSSVLSHPVYIQRHVLAASCLVPLHSAAVPERLAFEMQIGAKGFIALA